MLILNLGLDIDRRDLLLASMTVVGSDIVGRILEGGHISMCACVLLENKISSIIVSKYQKVPGTTNERV